MKQTIKVIIIVVATFYSLIVIAAYQKFLPRTMPSQAKWIFTRANACLHEDMITRIAANGECLAIQSYWRNKLPKKHPILLVFIHGDGIPGGGPSDYLKYQATKFSKNGVISVVLIRPGYYDSYGHYSTGESYAFSCNGYPCDSYRPHIVDTLAVAIKKLKQFYQARHVILIGHSGGAIMSSIILGRYSGLADGAVLASTTYNVHEWAKQHGWETYVNSLSPNKYVNKIPKHDFVYIISGTKDTDTYPKMAKKYYEALLKLGVKTKFFVVNGGTHNSVVLDVSGTKIFDQAIKLAVKNCNSDL